MLRLFAPVLIGRGRFPLYFSPHLPQPPLGQGGLLAHTFSGMSKRVLESPVMTTKFLSVVRQMKFERVPGFNCTLWRKADVKPGAKNTLLHRLANEVQYAREVHQVKCSCYSVVVTTTSSSY